MPEVMVTWAESGTMVAPSVEMQRRSEAASAEPNAQQQPLHGRNGSS